MAEQQVGYKRLSSAIGAMRGHYTVVVVGSGYGGGIAASRLARAGQSVCLLERGNEIQPGEYPRTKHEAIAQIQAEAAGHRLGDHNGLYDVRIYDDINVVVGCGLGGTSLINANVSIEADPRVFEDPRWPAALRADLPTRVADGYRRAREMLRPSPLPDRIELAKRRALEQSARALGATAQRANINVTFDGEPGAPNHVGVPQSPCNECGDCVTGCNVGAKNTTLMNYLPDAVAHGAELYTGVEVRRVSRAGGQYMVHYTTAGAPGSLLADVVVLAAGTLGSTEILLRSQREGLATSDRIGHGFTGNGDVLGFGYNCDQPINGIGWGDHAGRYLRDGKPRPGRGVGPTITSYIELRDAELDRGILIEEGAVPGPLAKLLPAVIAAAAGLFGRDTDRGLLDKLREKWRELVGFVAGPYHGALHNTQTYLVMGHEQSSGQIALGDNDRVRVVWRGIGDEPVFERIDRKLREATTPLGGTHLRNPLWSELFKHRLITVHPLGGCVMADDPANGVVNHKGQVFAGAGGEVHDGLYVADGAVIPRSLGCNPLLTISAIAERTCALIAADRGWVIDYALGPRPARAVAGGGLRQVAAPERP